jgi:tetratricopeptide (TPR) repeat protein
MKEKRDRERLEAECNQAMLLPPDSAENCHKRGQARWKRKDWDGAIAEFDRAIELDASHGEAYGGRGQLKWIKKDLAGALPDLNKALELMPGNHHLKEIRGFVKSGLKKSKADAKQNTGAKKIPKTENALVLRTDFSDETGWQKLCESLQNPENSSDDFTANVDFVSDRAFESLTAEQLPAHLADDSQAFAFIIDQTALANSGHPILVVDLQEEPGRTFRVIASELCSVENNLSAGNMEFGEFASAAGKDGIFRGFK